MFKLTERLCAQQSLSMLVENSSGTALDFLLKNRGLSLIETVYHVSQESTSAMDNVNFNTAVTLAIYIIFNYMGYLSKINVC